MREVLIRNLKTSVRPVLFKTNLDYWPFATNGGTLFLIEYRDSIYGVTCQHTLKGFSENLDQLVVYGSRHPSKGDLPAPISQFCFVLSPIEEAQGTNITDLCLIEFRKPLCRRWFKDRPYTIGTGTISQSDKGDALLVFGCPKDKLIIDGSNITIGYATLEFLDQGQEITTASAI